MRDVIVYIHTGATPIYVVLPPEKVVQEGDIHVEWLWYISTICSTHIFPYGVYMLYTCIYMSMEYKASKRIHIYGIWHMETL